MIVALVFAKNFCQTSRQLLELWYFKDLKDQGYAQKIAYSFFITQC
jgi:hypothetical protein